VTRALLDVELTVERRHAELVVAAIRRLRPQLVCHVATVTDRLQHAFLAFHSDRGQARRATPGRAGGARPGNRGYELADAELGRILAEMPPDTLVMVMSDHGFEFAPGSAMRTTVWKGSGPPGDR